ncbi:hypothetical protein SAMN04487762_1966 [Polaribacter sp. Hel1_33_78]|uniref:hypothetical protein n=1 Tax=Polaribacter sp. Hel1_33_78 TaxID=1336804 RepID=UPI00087D5107|nr:hypothetical protein [Polaribacter sp. Hel1_33_78]SDU12826.1 hypothetical protein SAMN04487762_1966 [Polaribacter sp. Hel1_33_78]
MSKSKKIVLKTRVEKALKKDVASIEVRNLYAFLDGYSKSSKKYNSLDIKVDSNLVNQK